VWPRSSNQLVPQATAAIPVVLSAPVTVTVTTTPTTTTVTRRRRPPGRRPPPPRCPHHHDGSADHDHDDDGSADHDHHDDVPPTTTTTHRPRRRFHRRPLRRRPPPRRSPEADARHLSITVEPEAVGGGYSSGLASWGTVESQSDLGGGAPPAVRCRDTHWRRAAFQPASARLRERSRHFGRQTIDDLHTTQSTSPGVCAILHTFRIVHIVGVQAPAAPGVAGRTGSSSRSLCPWPQNGLPILSLEPGLGSC